MCKFSLYPSSDRFTPDTACSKLAAKCVRRFFVLHVNRGVSTIRKTGGGPQLYSKTEAATECGSPHEVRAQKISTVCAMLACPKHAAVNSAGN